ncbi:MAG: translation elongation factor Ts [Spirochaetes bacterium]|nr:translation elongation factor Ts [Spirochaetota bacterium]
MAIDPKDIKTLREKTGAGIMDCKKALIEGAGDFKRAVKILREKGLAEATKRGHKEAKEGLIAVSESSDGTGILMAEINCETDFVSRTEKYVDFVRDIVTILLDKKTESADSLPEEAVTKIKEAAAAFGENILVRNVARFIRQDVGKSIFAHYIHLGGKAGVIAEFILEDPKKAQDETLKTFIKNILLQIASMNPLSVSKDDFPEDVLREQREIYMKQAQESGKPDAIIEKMVTGRIGKFFAENCLLNQKYVKDGDMTVEKYLLEVEKKIESSVKIARFARFRLGEE